MRARPATLRARAATARPSLYEGTCWPTKYESSSKTPGVDWTRRPWGLALLLRSSHKRMIVRSGILPFFAASRMADFLQALPFNVGNPESK
jgi:hypothetical protein